MKQSNILIKNALLLLTAFIWGTAFVAQSVGMDYIGPFTMNASRFLIGGIVLIPVICVLYKGTWGSLTVEEKAKKKQSTIKGGIVCGLCLFIAANFQQVGIAHTTVGKAGFITALYIIIVPLLGIFLHKKITRTIATSAVIAIVGFYLLSMAGNEGIGRGDLEVLACAFVFSFHILAIDYYSTTSDCVMMSAIQFLVAALFSGIIMLIVEQPTLNQITSAYVPILYTGVLSSGVGYTLQIVGQKDNNPTVASLIMSLESVFSALAGWVILHQSLSGRELLGCVLVFTAVILAQLPQKRENN